MVRHDWISLKNQFITSNWLTISDFFRNKGIKDNSRSRLHTRGWITEKRTYQEEIAKKTREQIIEKEVDIRIRQQKLAQELQVKGLKGLQKLPVKDAEDARKLMVSGNGTRKRDFGNKRRT